MDIATYDPPQARLDAIDRLARKTWEHSQPLYGERLPAVWMDYPDHPNVGDSAIWIGEMSAMTRSGGTVRAIVPTSCCTPAIVKRVLRRHPDAVVYLHGGGNFGGLYRASHLARLNVLRASVGRTVVQAAQSVHFRSDADRDALVDVCQQQTANFRIAVRDLKSLSRLQEAGLHAVLAPDAAHLLGYLPAPPPTQSFVVLRRTDREGIDDSVFPMERTVDWMEEFGRDRTEYEIRRHLYANRVLRQLSVALPGFVLQRAAARRVARGIALLSTGETIVTDRLHGAILGIQMGRAVIAVDNSIGKVSAYASKWLDDPGLNFSLVNDWDEARALVATKA